MRGVQQGALSHSWQATKNRERKRQKRSRNFRSARSRDEFIEIPSSHMVGVEKAIRRQGGEETAAYWGSSDTDTDRHFGSARRREGRATIGVRPVGLPNIKNSV